jgi:hypothetical protein
VRYMTFDIGSIECGESSGIVGMYATEAEAVEAADAAEQRHAANWNGQHHFEVFDLENPQLSAYAPKETE